MEVGGRYWVRVEDRYWGRGGEPRVVGEKGSVCLADGETVVAGILR